MHMCFPCMWRSEDHFLVLIFTFLLVWDSLSLFTTVHTRLAGTHISGQLSSLCLPYFSVHAEITDMCCCVRFFVGLGIWLHILTLVWPGLCPLRHVQSPEKHSFWIEHSIRYFNIEKCSPSLQMLDFKIPNFFTIAPTSRDKSKSLGDYIFMSCLLFCS